MDQKPDLRKKIHRRCRLERREKDISSEKWWLTGGPRVGGSWIMRCNCDISRKGHTIEPNEDQVPRL